MSKKSVQIFLISLGNLTAGNFQFYSTCDFWSRKIILFGGKKQSMRLNFLNKFFSFTGMCSQMCNWETEDWFVFHFIYYVQCAPFYTFIVQLWRQLSLSNRTSKLSLNLANRYIPTQRTLTPKMHKIQDFTGSITMFCLKNYNRELMHIIGI